jgi:enamine deaminase RidA (YjgF/YER057c/UK114 family)
VSRHKVLDEAADKFTKVNKTEMTVNFDIRGVESSEAAEIYISSTPRGDAPPQKQAQEIFSGIRKILRSKSASILHERVFAAGSVMEIIRSVRSKEYGDIDDGVAPSFLVGREGLCGPISGVQVHAVSGPRKPEVISLGRTLCGRIFRGQGRAYLTLSGISAPQAAQAAEQAQAILEKAEAALKQSGADFLLVPRTWMWLGDILSWYDDFNHVRNRFFTERGLIGRGSRQSLPASTGIGLGPAFGGSCAMDLTAVLEPVYSIQFLEAVGKQQCAFDYGSAFSRASRAITPAGETVFVSGTASIDAAGATTNIGDALGQINTTIENVRAVLRDMHCADEDVVQVVAYCKTTDVEKIFDSSKASLAWPWVTVICDICRPDLLFEIEAAAMPRK